MRQTTQKNSKPDRQDALNEARTCLNHITTLAELLRQSGGNGCLMSRLTHRSGKQLHLEAKRLKKALLRLKPKQKEP